MTSTEQVNTIGQQTNEEEETVTRHLYITAR